MTLNVIGTSHKVNFMFKNKFLLDIFFGYNLILSKLCMKNGIIKTHIFYKVKFDLKGHIMLHI